MTYNNSEQLDKALPAYQHDRTTIIIPCYNEANRLHLEAFLNFARENPKISFVFVDDGSKDLERSIKLISIIKNIALICTHSYR